VIDVCVSTHDNLPDLPAVLDCLFPLRGASVGRVLVIDNGSTDGGPQWVRTHRPWAEIVELGRNGGPSVSRNVALREPGSPWVLLLDGDCSLAPGCLEALLQDRAGNPAEVYSARVVYAGDPSRIYYDAGTAHFLGLLCLENTGVPMAQARAATRDPGAVSTSALLVSREAAVRAGLFDEGYLFFGEDLDFSLRLRAVGGRLRHVPEAVVLHRKPLPGTAPAADERERRARLRSSRQGPNRWRTLLKVCRAGTLLRTAPLHLAYSCVEALNALRESGFVAHLRGLWGFLSDLPRVLRERRRVQGSRTREDAELFGDPPLSWRPEVRAVPGAGLLQRVLERGCGLFWPAFAALLFLTFSAAGARAGGMTCNDCSLVVIGLDEAAYESIPEPFALWHKHLGELLTGLAQSPAPPAGNDATEEMKPKFIWGVLIKIAVNYAISAFGSYLMGKLTEQLTPQNVASMLLRNKSASIVPLGSVGGGGSISAKSAGAPENTVAGEPTTPLKVENGRENFQAVHVALMNFDRDGKALGFQPVTVGFKTGERFKLRVLPTFDGLLVIDNINPHGLRRQIYPAQTENVVKIKAGMEIMIPLGQDEYFEFAGATGDEQLVITLRDPRAFGNAAATAVVTRKDENNGSNFMQELTPNTYPVISQAMKLKHGS